MGIAKKVAVVDDEFFISKSLSFILEKAGYKCSVANDGQAGLDIIKREKPGLVILDITMPKMNGYQVCKAIRNDPEIKDTHVIMLTAMGQEADQKASLEAGANEYMLKPFNPRQIQKRVAEIMEK
ncbi:response regulator [Candidatus Poribacteria bacterium]|nr:response regulator [Candidatus Poribacteria bacterium]